MQTDYPEIRQEWLSDARLFATRMDMIQLLNIRSGGNIAEIGVAHGDFTSFLLDSLQPAVFHAVDLFEMHKYPEHWGIKQEVLLNGKTHLEYYKSRFASHSSRVKTHVGLSHKAIGAIPDNSLDLAYIDAGHDYENVVLDIKSITPKMRDNAFVIYNDYIAYDPFLKTEYGVVQAVNELMSRGGWKIVGFALQRHMFCDIALRMD